jgi:hypothetical protein
MDFIQAESMCAMQADIPEASVQSYRPMSMPRLPVLANVWDPLNDSEVESIMPRITGPGPAEMGLERLLVLSFANCQLAGNLPRVWGGMPMLESLSLGNNSLTGSPVMFGLPNLQQLRLENNKLTGSLHNVTNACYPMVKHLSLSGNALTSSLPPSWSTRTLVHLDVSMNRLNGTLPPEWGGLKDSQDALMASNLSSSLQSLLIQGNVLSGPIPSVWSAMRSLACWSLAGNPNMCGAVPANMTCPDGNGTTIGKLLKEHWLSH